MLRSFLLVLPALGLVAGCDSDCADAARIDGTYAMWHTVQNVGGEGKGTATENYPSYQTFINGWSKWKVQASTSGGTFSADITDVAELQGDFNDGGAATQPFSGKLTVSEDNCNVLGIHLAGTFVTSVDTSHDFVYDADLVFSGDHLSGTFSYDDTFTGTAEDGSAISGSLAGASGEVSGTLQVDAFDTGFTE